MGQVINQSTKRDPVAFAVFSTPEEARVLAGQLMSTSPWQRMCSLCREHPAVPSREEHGDAGVALPCIGGFGCRHFLLDCYY